MADLAPVDRQATRELPEIRVRPDGRYVPSPVARALRSTPLPARDPPHAAQRVARRLSLARFRWRGMAARIRPPARYWVQSKYGRRDPCVAALPQALA